MNVIVFKICSHPKDTASTAQIDVIFKYLLLCLTMIGVLFQYGSYDVLFFFDWYNILEVYTKWLECPSLQFIVISCAVDSRAIDPRI